MDWLFFLLNSLIFILVMMALLILAFAAGLLLVRFMSLTNPLFVYGIPSFFSLIAFALGSQTIYGFFFSDMPAMRWLNIFIVALLFPLTAPMILESLRYCRRELRR